jgi:hypothetical protein
MTSAGLQTSDTSIDKGGRIFQHRVDPSGNGALLRSIARPSLIFPLAIREIALVNELEWI